METESPLDQKRSIAVRTCAATLAKKLGCPLELVHVEDLTLYPISKPYYREYIQNFITQRRYRLKKIGGILNLPVRTSLLEGYPAEEITALTQKKAQYELIALGSHSRRGLKRAILGSVAEEVVRNSRIPVLILGATAQGRKEGLLLKDPLQILVATDLGKNGRKAEEYALSLAQRLSAKVTLFHSLLPLPQIPHGLGLLPLSGRQEKELNEFAQKIKPEAIVRLEKKQKKFRKMGISCSTLIEQPSDTASAAIVSQARKSKASLVIMGTHGRSSFATAFLGSTAREVIAESPLPLIIVRSR